MARSFTLTQDGESRSFTIQTGVGPTGPQGPAGADGAAGAGLADNNVWTGTNSFGAQVELTSQAATTATSAMTRGLADARYYPEQMAVNTSAETVTNSSTLTDSAQSVLTLETGTYWIEVLQIVAGSNSTGSSKLAMSFTGTASASGVAIDRGWTAATDASNADVVYDGGVFTWNSPVAFNFGGNTSGIVFRRFLFTVTAGGNLSTSYAQAVATSGQTATLKIGSFIKTKKIS